MSEPFVSWQSLRNGTEVPLLRDGVPSFLGVPVARTPSELRGADVVVVGIPSGAQESPGRPPGQWSDYGRAVADTRRFSMRYGGDLPGRGLHVFQAPRGGDLRGGGGGPGDGRRPARRNGRPHHGVAHGAGAPPPPTGRVA